MKKSEKVLLLSTIILLGFVFAVIYHYILGFYFNFQDPILKSFLWTHDKPFDDFIGLMPAIKNLNPFSTNNISSNYFPLAYILLYPFSLIKNVLISYSIFIMVFLSFLIFSNIKNLSCDDLTKLQNFQNIFILTFISYPLIMILDRGNFDMMLFILFSIFIYLFQSGKFAISALILAIINAIKPFFAIFLILFLFKKKIKEALLSIVLSVVLILGGFMLLKGGLLNQAVIFIRNLFIFKINYAYENNNCIGMFAGSSLFMMLKLFFTRLTPSLISTNLLIQIYSYIGFLLTSITIFFTWKETILWKQITLLSLYMLLIPYSTNDYKLIFLFVPIWLFVNFKEKSKLDLIYTVLFGLLLIPKNIIIVTSTLNPNAWFSLSIIINPLLIMLFMSLIIYEQIKNKKEVINEKN